MSNRKRGGKQSSSNGENLEPPTTSAAAVSFSESIPNQNRRNYRWGPRGRGGPHTIKQQFVKKSEVGSSNRDEKSEKREADSGGKGAGLKLEQINDEVVQENVVNQEEKQDSYSDKADEVQKSLEKLVLSAHEPELSEEQLKINDQAQEDEVILIVDFGIVD